MQKKRKISEADVKNAKAILQLKELQDIEEEKQTRAERHGKIAEALGGTVVLSQSEEYVELHNANCTPCKCEISAFVLLVVELHDKKNVVHAFNRQVPEDLGWYLTGADWRKDYKKANDLNNTLRLRIGIEKRQFPLYLVTRFSAGESEIMERIKQNQSRFTNAQLKVMGTGRVKTRSIKELYCEGDQS